MSKQIRAITVERLALLVAIGTLPHWPPHLMFFHSDTDPAIWGANQPGSPVIAVAHPMVEHLTQFVIPVERWSDGTECH